MPYQTVCQNDRRCLVVQPTIVGPAACVGISDNDSGAYLLLLMVMIKIEKLLCFAHIVVFLEEVMGHNKEYVNCI